MREYRIIKVKEDLYQLQLKNLKKRTFISKLFNTHYEGYVPYVENDKYFFNGMELEKIVMGMFFESINKQFYFLR